MLATHSSSFAGAEPFRDLSAQRVAAEPSDCLARRLDQASALA